MRILLIDDDRDFRTAFKAFVSPFGDCDEAEDGRKGLSAVCDSYRKDLPYDLICLDLSMPAMHGMEALGKIRKLEDDLGIDQEKRPKIVIITSYGDEAIISNAKSKGCSSYLEKKKVNEASVKQLLEELSLL